MNLMLIILIIVVGLIFMFIEIFLIPGTSILTLLGFVVIGIGIYLGYSDYGQTIGNWLFISSVVGAGVTLYIGYKRIQSKKWALYTNVDGRVNVADLSSFRIGDAGKTISALRPEGQVIFSNNERTTVYSVGEFIDKGTDIEITKIHHNKIFVKPLNKS